MNHTTFPGLDDERPLSQLPDMAHWSENYCFEGYDPDADIGFWLHLGRWPRNPEIWREMLWLYLPDGRYTSMRGFGACPVPNGPGGALMTLHCDEPGIWQLRFSGPTRMGHSDLMLAPPRNYLSDGPFAAIDFDIEFVATQPAWHFGDVLQEENWCHFHYEQHGALKGTIGYQPPGQEWQRWSMDGHGYRDHSRGPRELSTFGGNYWIHGQFPNGRAFSLMQVWKIEQGERVPAFSQAMVYQDGNMYPAEFSGVPYIEDPHNPSSTYRLRLTSELDTMAIDARVVRTVTQSGDTYMDTFDGIAGPENGVLFCYEQATEFSWDGILGSGHTERAERTR